MFSVVVCAFALGGCATFGELTPTKAISDLSATGAATVTKGSFVTKWLVLGPFEFKVDDFGGDQQQAAADKAFVPDEAGLNGLQILPKPAVWAEKQFTDDSAAGRVDLDGVFGGIDHAAAYAVSWLHCSEEIAGVSLLVGSDDYITVWVNGKAVHTYKTERRAGEADQDKIENIKLRKGYNRIVVKCVDVVFGWNFFLRFADKDGKPIAVKARVL
jgi:hypothetical protein